MIQSAVPAGIILTDLRAQQASLEEEMKVMKVELEKALVSGASLHLRSPERPPPLSTPLHASYPVSPYAGLAPSSPYVSVNNVERDVFASPRTPIQHHQPLHATTNTTTTVQSQEPDLIWSSQESNAVNVLPYPYADDTLKGSPERRWNLSTAVPPVSRYTKPIKPQGRPQPLYCGARPKSVDFYELKRKAGGARSRSKGAGGGGLRKGPTRSVGASSRLRTATERERSPEMDLVTRAPQYFDEDLMLSSSVLACGGAAGSAGEMVSTRTPLRGEYRPCPTTKGLWATVPNGIRRVAKDTTEFSRG